MNTFGKKLKLTTFGESHGVCIGGVIDGYPSGIKIDMDYLKAQLEKRRGGGTYTTKRAEADEVEILSGVYEGVSTGAPIGFVIKNTDTKSSHYSKDVFRPSHSDFTYFHKYGIYDFRGGGRSSARESVARVVGGVFCEFILQGRGICTYAGLYGVGGIVAENIDFEYSLKDEIFSLDSKIAPKQKEAIENARAGMDSVGGVALVVARGNLLGLGEPLYDKLDGAIAGAMMGINGVKAVEIGLGVESSSMRGSSYNDQIGKDGFYSNNSGGILGGIGNGEDIVIKVHFKPTPSIFLPQKSINTKGEEVTLELKGRHDPCIAVRGVIVARAMMNLVLADFVL